MLAPIGLALFIAAGRDPVVSWHLGDPGGVTGGRQKQRQGDLTPCHS
jgi:hypothetical protein